MTGIAVPTRQRFRTANPLHTNANALILSTVLTSAAGLVFWALAARWLPADSVGLGTALVSVLTLLANLATLGLRNGVVRFLPSAGASARRLIAGSYAACTAAAVLLSGVFLLGQPLWSAQLGFLRDNVFTIGAFTAATVVWVLFVLQDDVLVGLRKSVWVPVENLAYALAKIAVLPALAFTATWAVLAATVLPAVLAVAAVSVLLLRLSHPSRLGSGGTGRISVAQLVRFAAADQTAWLISACTAPVLTLIVLEVQGPEASAYFYMANMIGYTLYLITSNIGSALIAESVHDPEHAATHTRAALVHSLRLVLPLAAAGVVAGPLALRIFFGEDYATHAGGALQLIILSALPQTIIGISISTARVRRQMSTVVVTYGFLAVTIWGGSWAALQWWGVTGVGATILVAHVLAAVGLVVTGRAGLGVGGSATGTLWSLVARLSLAARHGATRRDSGGRLRPALEACGLPVTAGTRVMKSDSDTLVAAVTAPGGDCVLKISTSDAADRNLARHVQVVEALREIGDDSFAALLPRILDQTTADGRAVVRETLLPGRTRGDDSTPAALAAIGRLHSATARTRTVTPRVLASWLDPALRVLRESEQGARNGRATRHLADYLGTGLLDAEVTVSWIHGDYWPGNVLVSDSAHGPLVTGIVDWENGLEPGMPDVDLVHWYLSTRTDDLGAAVCSLLDDPSAVERSLDAAGVSLANAHVGIERIVLLVWLWHVANMLSRSTRNGPGRIWHLRNVQPVLKRFESDPSMLTGGGRGGHTR